MSIPKYFIDEVLAKTRISDIIGKRISIKKKGNEYWGCCPFHGEKTPSFSINDSKGFYHCFGCEAHGSAVNFLMEYEKLSFVDSVKNLALELGLQTPENTNQENSYNKKFKLLKDIMESACNFYQKNLKKQRNKHALEYLLKRELSPEIINKFKLGFSNNKNELTKYLIKNNFKEDDLIEVGLLIKVEQQNKKTKIYERFRNRIIFPICNIQGEVIAFGGRVLDNSEPKYLNSPDTPLFKKGNNLYALNHTYNPARKYNQLIICEGYMDVIAIHNAKIPFAVAPLGTALTEEQILLSWKYADTPTLCFDGDKAGISASHRSAKRTLPHLHTGKSIKFLTLPNKEDPDSYIKNNSSKKFIELINNKSVNLSSYLWNYETQNGFPTSAEKRAILEKQLLEYTNIIPDKILAQHLKTQFKNNIWNATKEQSTTKQQYVNNQTIKNTTDLTKQQRLHIQNNADQLNTLILLTSFMEHPSLLKQYSQNLSFIKSTPNSPLHKIVLGLQNIINDYEEDLSNTKFNVKEKLLNYITTEDINYLDNFNIKDHAIWLKSDDPLVIQNNFDIIIKTMELTNIKKEIDNIKKEIIIPNSDKIKLLQCLQELNTEYNRLKEQVTNVAE